MMVYEVFIETVKNSLQSCLGSDFTVTSLSIPKNNGLSLDAVSITHQTKPLAPVICMAPYYTAYEDGMTMEEILEDLTCMITDGQNVSDIQLDSLTDISGLTDRVIFQLVNLPANSGLLADIPCRLYPDLELALIFYLQLDNGKNSNTRALISNRHIRIWGMTADDLYRMALVNSPVMFPPSTRSMTEVMADIIWKLNIDPETPVVKTVGEALLEAPDKLYCLTNSIHLGGASCMMYPGVLKNFADEMGTDLLIIPSSIHEVLLAPCKKDTSFANMSKPLLYANQTDVPITDQLSNMIFRYTRSDDRLTVAFNPCVPIETENP